MLHRFVASAGNRPLRPLVVVTTTMPTALVPIGTFAMALSKAHLRQICWMLS